METKGKKKGQERKMTNAGVVAKKVKMKEGKIKFKEEAAKRRVRHFSCYAC